jgi:hypothetical protein
MANDEEQNEERGFKVKDRRRFSSETGESRENTENVAPSEEKKNEASVQQAVEKDTESKGALPAIDFPTFIISLSTQALMHLGEIPDPLSGNVEMDISVGKQMIDIIGMLSEKTRGNLDQGEEKLMEDILFDLRMKYVEAVRKK